MNKFRALCIPVLFLILLSIPEICAGEPFTSLEEFKAPEPLIGVLTGSLSSKVAEVYFPGKELAFYNSYPDLTLALLEKKIDGFMVDSARIWEIERENPRITHIPDEMEHYQNAFIYRKDLDPEIKEQLNGFLTELLNNGEIDEMIRIWTGKDLSVQKLKIPAESLKGENGTLSIATDTTAAPFGFNREGKIVGLCIDILTRFGKEYGYKFTFEDMPFGSIVAGITSGKYDIGGTGVMITPERLETMEFGTSFYEDGFVMAVLLGNDTEGASESFLRSLKTGFEKTFLDESRWKLFLSGIGKTLLITISAIVFGTILGFLLFLVFYYGGKSAETLLKAYSWFMKGIPMVVFLMILYYLVFANTSISGTGIAIIGFSLFFGAVVFGLIRDGVNTIEKGQTEGALALGYKPFKALLRVILPQAAAFILPPYKTAVTNLLKGTAIVGYIAVEDLTKVSDIVRSRTYQAFFPLLTSALLYYLLGRLLARLIGKVQIRYNSNQQTKIRILKGVISDDQN